MRRTTAARRLMMNEPDESLDISIVTLFMLYATICVTLPSVGFVNKVDAEASLKYIMVSVHVPPLFNCNDLMRHYSLSSHQLIVMLLMRIDDNPII